MNNNELPPRQNGQPQTPIGRPTFKPSPSVIPTHPSSSPPAPSVRPGQSNHDDR